MYLSTVYNAEHLKDFKDNSMSRVPDQNGVSLLYITLQMHHSGREPSMCCTLLEFSFILVCCLFDTVEKWQAIRKEQKDKLVTLIHCFYGKTGLTMITTSTLKQVKTV